MHLKQSPFDTQELVASIIWHLDHDDAPGQSKQDFLTCALVARLWTYPAQSCIFRQLLWRPSHLCLCWPLLRRALGSAPYLVQHIRRLRIYSGELPTNFVDLFSDMCTFSFTHLEHADVFVDSTMPVQNVLAVRELFGLTTLRSVGFRWMRSSYDLESFRRLWELCSPSIKHLVLHLYAGSSSYRPPPISAPRRSQTPVIFLESLYIYTSDSLDHVLHATPFSLGQLNKLSVSFFIKSVSWHPFVLSLQSLQYLAFGLDVRVLGSYDTPSNPVIKFGQTTPSSIDLSLLPNLVVLGIWFNRVDAAERELKVLSTINAAHQISTIIFQTSVFVSSACEKLDAKLSSLPMRQPPIVVLDMDDGKYYQWRQNMPTLRSSNLLRRADPKCSCCKPLSAWPFARSWEE
ncbi:hypothetical protein GGX14DRAFT_635241 [Mycena pura]|uniref:Uncharacterized protein n=1 Tax=Mycena pura TaxID=153505 RepID=A0AAD6YFP7_9AGAR|nr:hypothetical protein GGX14DRAFT_635241 [Mycena pura]